MHKYITQEACTTLLLMLCISHLDYSNTVLYGIPNKTLNKYQRIQNMCAKLVLGKSKYDSSTESLKALHWLPIQQQIKFRILTITHKYINNLAPKYLQITNFSQGANKGKYEIQQCRNPAQYTNSQTNNICSQILWTCCTDTME